MLNLYCILSILVSRLVIHNSILFLRFWTIFTVIIWNSLSGRFPISPSFVCFGGHLSCSFTCWVFLCLSSCLYCCVCGGLSVFWQFVVFSGFERKPPASGFQSYSYSSLNTSSSPFEDNGLLFWVSDVLCHHSEVILQNLLSVQMFFWWICGGESGLPVLFLHHLRTAPLELFLNCNVFG